MIGWLFSLVDIAAGLGWAALCYLALTDMRRDAVSRGFAAVFGAFALFMFAQAVYVA